MNKERLGYIDPETQKDLGDISLEEIGEIANSKMDILSVINNVEDAKAKKLLFKFVKYYSLILENREESENRSVLESLYEELEDRRGLKIEVSHIESLCLNYHDQEVVTLESKVHDDKVAA